MTPSATPWSSGRSVRPAYPCKRSRKQRGPAARIGVAGRLAGGLSLSPSSAIAKAPRASNRRAGADQDVAFAVVQVGTIERAAVGGGSETPRELVDRRRGLQLHPGPRVAGHGGRTQRD